MFGKRDENGEVRVPLLAEKHTFDELTRGVADGTISRSRALKLAGAALLGAALIPFSAAPAEAGRRDPCKGKPAISNNSCRGERAICRQREDQVCVCAKIVDGGKSCVEITKDCPTTDECDRNSDCPGSQLCVELGACCEGSPRNACLRPCR